MQKKRIPRHVAIILDGNGRWAKKRHKPRSYGHYHGARNLFTIARAARTLGIERLTVYAFSTENWKRPKEEVDYLMNKPVEAFAEYRDRLDEIGFRVRFIGRRDRFSEQLLEVIERIESVTSRFSGFELVIAADYGSHDEIIRAVNQLQLPVSERELESKLMLEQPVDLLIRTSGEKRISNFLLWQISYAELHFARVHWPAFRLRHLKRAIKDYQKRQRRFGGLS
ncbi:MAG: polyprenyl diphosphate synthase [Acholeplasmataceae bacterium]